MGFHSPLPWWLHYSVLRIKNPDIRLRRITYTPEHIPPSPSIGVIDEVASLVEEWGRGWVPTQADMLSACSKEPGEGIM